MKSKNVLRVMSNLDLLRGEFAQGKIERVAHPIQPDDVGWLQRIRLFWRARHCDYLLLMVDPVSQIFYGVLRWLLRWSRPRLVSVDSLPRNPTGLRDRMLWPMKKLGIRQADLHLTFCHNQPDIAQVFGVSIDRIRYIPFKVNSFEKVGETITRDGGYVFTGGVTRRDYHTFLEAIRGIDVPVRIMSGSPEALKRNGTEPYCETDLPPNVDEITDLDPVRFRNEIAGARVVVVPLRSNPFQASGLSLYLEAMAYKKCVIVTSVLGVKGVLTGGEAIVVPPNDAVALRREIERAANDAEYREQFAARGHAYAMSLGGEDELMHTIAREVFADQRQRQSEAARRVE